MLGADSHGHTGRGGPGRHVPSSGVEPPAAASKAPRPSRGSWSGPSGQCLGARPPPPLFLSAWELLGCTAGRASRHQARWPPLSGRPEEVGNWAKTGGGTRASVRLSSGSYALVGQEGARLGFGLGNRRSAAWCHVISVRPPMPCVRPARPRAPVPSASLQRWLMTGARPTPQEGAVVTALPARRSPDGTRGGAEGRAAAARGAQVPMFPPLGHLPVSGPGAWSRRAPGSHPPSAARGPARLLTPWPGSPQDPGGRAVAPSVCPLRSALWGGHGGPPRRPGGREMAPPRAPGP